MSHASSSAADVKADVDLAPQAFAEPVGDAAIRGIGWAAARDLRLALRSRAELGVQLLFYVIVVALFPLTTTPERNLLATMGPGVLWVAALLASLLSLPRLFAADYADGTLEQIALSPMPLEALVSGKILAHWLTTGLPVVALVPLTGLQYQLDGESLAVLVAGLLLGTPILSLLGAIGAALTLGLRGGGSLLALLILPLYVPVLIFGAGAVDSVRAGLGAAANLSLLGAGLALAIVAAPFAASAAVRIALD
jgi:heme exporter protein B